MEKDITDYTKDISKKDMLNDRCKSCINTYNKKKYDKYELLSVSKVCYKCDVEKDIKDFVKMKNICKSCKNKYNYKNKEKYKDYHKNYHKNYGAKEENKLKKKINSKKWRDSNKERERELHRENLKKRYNNDTLFKLSVSIRNSIRQSFKKSGYIKESHTYEILGCSYEDFKIYLESKFESWMCWDNYGLYDGNFNTGWDIDHIEPLFPEGVERTPEDIIRLNHYTNLQPLCSKINRDIKKNKLDFIK
jgi:hypothetical protein